MILEVVPLNGHVNGHINTTRYAVLIFRKLMNYGIRINSNCENYREIVQEINYW